MTLLGSYRGIELPLNILSTAMTDSVSSSMSTQLTPLFVYKSKAMADTVYKKAIMLT